MRQRTQTGVTRGLLVTVLLLAAGALAAQPRPSSDLLLPYFEVELRDAGDATGLTTVFAVGNASFTDEVDLLMTLFSNWGVPMLEVPLTLAPDEVKTFNLRDWLVAGQLPPGARFYAYDPAATYDLAHLREGLCGHSSPADHLYYATEIPELGALYDVARGFMTLRVVNPARLDVLWGDFFIIDPQQDLSQGELLVDLDPLGAVDPCSRGSKLFPRHLLRFATPWALAGDTRVVIWTNAWNWPSDEPVFSGPMTDVKIDCFDEPGHQIDHREMECLPVEAMSVRDSVLPEVFGWLDLRTLRAGDEIDSVLIVLHGVENRHSVAVRTWCRREPPPPPEPEPAIEVEKLTNGQDADEAPGPSIPVGAAVEWEYVVTNSGNQPLSNVTVTDSEGLEVSCPKPQLAVGESMVCTASGVAEPCQYANEGEVSAQVPGGPTVSASDPSHYWGDPGETASVDLEKATNGHDADLPPGPTIAAGAAVTWSYQITNNGELELSGVVVSDDQLGAVSCPASTLAPGESMTCTASGVALPGQYANLGAVTATAQLQCGDSVTVGDEDPSHYLSPLPRPAIDLEKSTNGVDADSPPGVPLPWLGAVTWSYRVTNTGNVTLTGIVVSDDRLGVVSCPASTLEPGESMTCIASGLADQCLYANLGQVVGVAPDGSQVGDSDPSHYFLDIQAAIDLEKSTNGVDADQPPGPQIPVGAVVEWSYWVTNNGDIPLVDVAVSDDQLGAVSCPASALQPGESMTCVATGIAVAGGYANLGTAVGTPEPPCVEPVTDSDPSHYTGEGGDQGCTPGYWKNHLDSWVVTGYSPGQSVVSVFPSAGGYPSLADASLVAALDFGGGPGVEGAAKILLRAAVAALLNASHPDVDYPYTGAQVLAEVDAALAAGLRDPILLLAAGLDAANNLGCPLS